MRIFLFAGVFVLALQVQARAQEIVDYASSDELRNAIHIAIRDSVTRNNEPPFYLVKAVELKLNGVEDQSVGGGFKVPVFGIDVGAEAMESWSSGSTKTIKLNPRDPIPTQAAPRVPFAEDVAALKEEARAAEEDGWSADTATISYSWSMKQSVEGGIEILFVKLGGEAATGSTQSVTFHLCRTVNKLECVDG